MGHNTRYIAAYISCGDGTITHHSTRIFLDGTEAIKDSMRWTDQEDAFEQDEIIQMAQEISDFAGQPGTLRLRNGDKFVLLDVVELV